MVRSLARATALALFLALPLTAESAQKSPDDPPSAKKDDAPKPPAGWTEYSPRDGSYVVWVPAKTKSRSERERTTTVRGQRLRIQLLAAEVAGGPSYVAEAVTLSPGLAKEFKPGELSDLFRDLIASETGGKVADESDVKAGTIVGKEYRVESARAVTRARVFVTGGRVLILRVAGRKEQVDAEAAGTFLGSGRLTAGGGAAARDPAGKAPTILGGAFDPEFKDTAPEGALLVGFEIGLGKFFDRDMIRAARPIYRTGDKEVLGTQYGTQLTKVVTIKAKPGYAVGAMAVKHGLGFDGMSVTFMKVSGDKLDPTDSYESEFVGSDEKKTPTKVTGGGLPVVGIVGKTNDKDMTGMGLLFKGQTFEPKKK
jgi:hypothetical protein